jgi:hypothetical protein
MRRPIKPFTVEVKRLRTSRPGSETSPTKIEIASKDSGEPQKLSAPQSFFPPADIAPPRRILESLAPEPHASAEEALAEEVLAEDDPSPVARKPGRRKAAPIEKLVQESVRLRGPSVQAKRAPVLVTKGQQKPDAPESEQASVRRVKRGTAVLRRNLAKDSDSSESQPASVPVARFAPVTQISTVVPVLPAAPKVAKKPERRDESAPLPRSERWKRRLPKILW